MIKEDTLKSCLLEALTLESWAVAPTIGLFRSFARLTRKAFGSLEKIAINDLCVAFARL